MISSLTHLSQSLVSRWLKLRHGEARWMGYFQQRVAFSQVLPYIYLSKQTTKTRRYYVYLFGLGWFQPWIGVITTASLYLGRLVTNQVKLWVQQPRPYNSYSEVEFLLRQKHTYSFPSQSTMSAMTCLLGYRRAGYGWWSNYYFGVLLFILGTTRVYRGLHYPHDLVASMALAVLVNYWVAWLGGLVSVLF